MTHSPAAIERLAREYTAAWNSGKAEAVAALYAEDGEIVINGGETFAGRSRTTELAAGLMAGVPDLSLTCDDIRSLGSHAVFVWTFTGHDAESGKPLNNRGWEEWDLNDDLRIRTSRGWFDAEDYGRQAATT